MFVFSVWGFFSPLKEKFRFEGVTVVTQVSDSPCNSFHRERLVFNIAWALHCLFQHKQKKVKLFTLILK